MICSKYLRNKRYRFGKKQLPSYIQRPETDTSIIRKNLYNNQINRAISDNAINSTASDISDTTTPLQSASTTTIEPTTTTTATTTPLQSTNTTTSLEPTTTTTTSPMQTTQISQNSIKYSPSMKHSLNSNALFQECLETIRQRSSEIHSRAEQYEPSPMIDRLTQAELEITRALFSRMDEDLSRVKPGHDGTAGQKKNSRLLLENRSSNIDPYWEPFKPIDDIKESIRREVNILSKNLSLVEKRKLQFQIATSLNRYQRRGLYNPYSNEYKINMSKRSHQPFPEPVRKLDTDWYQTPFNRHLNTRKFSWRRPDLLNLFLAKSGMLIPRRITTLSRKKHESYSTQTKTARRNYTLDSFRSLRPGLEVPLMDPIQFLVGRLTRAYMGIRRNEYFNSIHLNRQEEKAKNIPYHVLKRRFAEKVKNNIMRRRDRRSEAMLMALSTEYAPNLNYSSAFKEIRNERADILGDYRRIQKREKKKLNADKNLKFNSKFENDLRKIRVAMGCRVAY